MTSKALIGGLLASAAAMAIAGPASADGYLTGRRLADTAAPYPAAAQESRPPCYIRSDVGYGWSASSDARAQIAPAGYGTALGDVQGTSLGESFFSEIGFGCSFNRQSTLSGSIKDQPVAVSAPGGLRGDLTLGFYKDRSFSGTPLSPASITPVVDPVHASVRASTLMFNLYYDLPAMYGMTPYVGGGLGMAFVDMRNTTFTNGSVVNLADASATNVAWNLTAGVAADVGRGIMLDVAYRYLSLGDIRTSDATSGYGLRVQDLGEHQIKAGLRIPVEIGR